jgi:hypothetical protein
MNPLRPVVAVGQCRYCKCTEDDPCKTPGGNECGWVTAKKDRCSAPGCLVAFDAERRRAWEKDGNYLRAMRELRAKGSKKKSKRYQRRAA